MRTEDEIFVNRCLEGDQAAFDFLVNKYKEVVHAYAYHKVGDYQDAQDIAQEVFMKAYSKLAQLKWPHRFQSWLYTIVSNECKMWRRSHSKERDQEVSWEDVPVETLNELAVRNHSDQDIELTVKSAMETLPGDNRLALSLYYMSDLSVKEIASFMGVSPNTVKGKLHRARKQLGERLEKMIGKHLSKEKLKGGFVFKVVDSIRDMPIPSIPKPRPTRWMPIPISIGVAVLIGVIGYGVSSGRDVSSDMPILKPVEATFEVSLLPNTDGQTVSDMEVLDMGSEDIYQSDLAAADSGTTTQTQPAIGVRKVWDTVPWFYGVSPSPDGRYVSYINWETGGNLAMHNFETGENRDITDEGKPGESESTESIWSPDSKQIAYRWFSAKKGSSLRIVGIDGSRQRVLCSSPPKSGFLMPQTWSRDGKHILAFHCKKTDEAHDHDIVLVSAADGSVRVLKSLGQRCHWPRMSLSPDSRYVVYDYPQSEDSSNRDIFLFSTDGSHEMTLVEHPANDRVPFWVPDGSRIVFISDRSGSKGVWVLDVVEGKPEGSPRLIKHNLNGMFPLGVTQDSSYYYGFEDRDSDVYVATLDPETGQVMTPPAKAVQSFEGLNCWPVFSTDGKCLAYVSRRPKGSDYSRVLVIRSLETGGERVFSPEHIEIGHSPRWSPDGRSILILALGRTDALDIYQIDTETGAATPVVLSDEQGLILLGQFAWSPDGSKIFFRRRRDGVRLIRVYDFETEREWSPDFQLACGEGYRTLALSPDGQQLAFIVRCDNEWSLQIAPSSGGDTHEVLRLRQERASWGGGGLVWTQDGRHLLFLGNRKDEATGLCELWRIPVEGGEPQNLDLTMKAIPHISFHPDGRRLAFTGPGPASGEIWAMENFLPESTASSR